MLSLDCHRWAELRAFVTVLALGCRPRVRFEDGMAGLMNRVRHQQAADAFERAREELARRGLAG